MIYVGTERLNCSDCGTRLDVPVYYNGDKATYGFNYCPVCAKKLFDKGVDYKSELVKARRKCEELARKLLWEEG